MLANHTSIRTIFRVLLGQYKKLRKRDAFMDQYKQTEMFSDSLQEFDDSEEIVRNLIDEYEAAESQEYLDWGAMEEMKDDNDGMNY